MIIRYPRDCRLGEGRFGDGFSASAERGRRRGEHYSVARGPFHRDPHSPLRRHGRRASAAEEVRWDHRLELLVRDRTRGLRG